MCIKYHCKECNRERLQKCADIVCSKPQVVQNLCESHSGKSDNKNSNDQTLNNIIGIGGVAIASALGGALLAWWFAEPDRSPQHHEQPTRHFQDSPPLHDPTCAICLVKHNVIMLPCEHSFDSACIRDWFTRTMRNNGRMICPTCRFAIPRNMENEYSERLSID